MNPPRIKAVNHDHRELQADTRSTSSAEPRMPPWTKLLRTW